MVLIPPLRLDNNDKKLLPYSVLTKGILISSIQSIEEGRRLLNKPLIPLDIYLYFEGRPFWWPTQIKEEIISTNTDS